jgi:hypothetical protein
MNIRVICCLGESLDARFRDGPFSKSARRGAPTAAPPNDEGVGVLRLRGNFTL